MAVSHGLLLPSRIHVYAAKLALEITCEVVTGTWNSQPAPCGMGQAVPWPGSGRMVWAPAW